MPVGVRPPVAVRVERQRAATLAVRGLATVPGPRPAVPRQRLATVPIRRPGVRMERQRLATQAVRRRLARMRVRRLAGAEPRATPARRLGTAPVRGQPRALAAPPLGTVLAPGPAVLPLVLPRQAMAADPALLPPVGRPGTPPTVARGAAGRVRTAGGPRTGMGATAVPGGRRTAVVAGPATAVRGRVARPATVRPRVGPVTAAASLPVGRRATARRSRTRIKAQVAIPPPVGRRRYR
jgi:hypothetical protein